MNEAQKGQGQGSSECFGRRQWQAAGGSPHVASQPRPDPGVRAPGPGVSGQPHPCRGRSGHSPTTVYAVWAGGGGGGWGGALVENQGAVSRSSRLYPQSAVSLCSMRGPGAEIP